MTGSIPMGITNNAKLSSAAQAVLSAYEAVPIVGMYSEYYDRLAVAAALRAAMDLVAPENYVCFTGHVDWDLGMEARNDSVRENLLAIAAELEGTDD